MEATVIFPHQLFIQHPSVRRGRPVYLVEDGIFFGGPRKGIHFHRNKIVLHRASMKAYEKLLTRAGHKVTYLEYDSDKSICGLHEALLAEGVKALHCADPVDTYLEKQLTREITGAGIVLNIDPTPAFLTQPSWFRSFFENASHYSLTHFYIAQRKRLGILLERGKPVGGKWTFDTENREPLPANALIPQSTFSASNAFAKEARDYAQRRFPGNPGDTSSFFYPVTHEEALKWLRDFLENRLSLFGKYQDAIRRNETVLFHSILSPLLNIGLVTPEEVVDETLNFVQNHPGKIPVNSLEGFLRQIIGWREFVRAVYVLEGNRQRSQNFWGHERTLPQSFYGANTGMEPFDNTILRLHKQAYTHHIERLMILGNFMLLCEIHPDAIYRWFMDMFIDAYDWVMVPNVYGMSQYADGGLMTTKPYISSSRYILRMSDYKKEPWCETWDALYWRFIDRHREVFQQIPRMSVMVSAFDRMPAQRQKDHLKRAENFLKRL